MRITHRSHFVKSLLAGFALLALAVPQSASAADAKSTWDQVMSTKKIRSGVLDAPPYFYRSTDPGNVQGWKGAMVSMSQDIAKELGVDLELVDVGGWGQVVLNLTGNKIDMNFSLQATPTRARAIDFAGPAYWISYVLVNSDKFHAKTWADYNKPEVRISAELGSSAVPILRKMTPKANINWLKDSAETLLSVKSGHSDAMLTTTMTGLIQKTRNPDIGEFVVPTPVVAMPGYIGVRLEDDSRFQKFLQRWSEWNLLLGNNEQLLKDNLSVMGIKDIPESVHF